MRMSLLTNECMKSYMVHGICSLGVDVSDDVGHD
jgi:hypothetical protein